MQLTLVDCSLLAQLMLCATPSEAVSDNVIKVAVEVSLRAFTTPRPHMYCTDVRMHTVQWVRGVYMQSIAHSAVQAVGSVSSATVRWSLVRSYCKGETHRPTTPRELSTCVFHRLHSRETCHASSQDITCRRNSVTL